MTSPVGVVVCPRKYGGRGPSVRGLAGVRKAAARATCIACLVRLAVGDVDSAARGPGHHHCPDHEAL